MKRELHQPENFKLWRAPGDYLTIVVVVLLLVLQTAALAQVYGPPTRYEAENGFNSSGVTTSTANSGYSGSGYVTGLTVVNAETKFDKGVSTTTATKMDIRYANGTGANVTNLALYIGSNQKIQDLVFPPTTNWGTWSTISVMFNHEPNWGSNIVIKSLANVTTSVNIDYSEISVDDGTAAPAATPTFSPVAGTYTSAQSVTISSSTSGSTIYYTTDNSTPTTSSSVYSSPVSVSSTKTVKAIAVKSGFYNSAVGSASYTINLPTVATPTFSPAAGTYSTTQSVTISSSTSGATIYYTTDNSTPTTSSSVYSSAISVTASQTIKALAVKSGLANSAIVSAAYTISAGVVSTPTFSPAAGTYSSAQSVTISSTTSGSTIYYTTDNSTPTTFSAVYSTALNVNASQTIKALAVKSGYTNSSIGSAAYTINIPPPAPGSFTQTAPSSGATGVSTTPTFTWGASSNASTYTLVVSTSSSFSSPVINQTSLTGTSYTGTALSNSTLYYWKVTATNSTASTVAGNSGISFTTGSAPAGQPGVTREYWAGIPGTAISALTGNANYPNNPTSSSILTSFSAPNDIADSYGQRIKGYLAPTVTGSYKFWIASDDDGELWLSTNDQPSSKVKIASVSGWTNYLQFDKFSSQASASITLTAGNYYYIEALMKEDGGGDHLTVAWQVPGGSQVIIPSTNLVTAPPVPIPLPGNFTQTAPVNGATGVSTTPAFSWASSSDAATYSLVVSTNSAYTSPVVNVSGLTSTSYTPSAGLAGNTLYYWKVTAVNSTGSKVATNAGISFTTLIPPAPGGFTQTAPASGATGVSSYPVFSWASSSNAASYSLIVSTNSTYASPIVNQTGLTTNSYTASSPFALSTLYYWRVTAVNGTGSTVATNAGISFTTGASSGTTYYVSTTGVDAPANGTSGSPWRTLAYAASQVTAGTGNKTISLAPGTYVETACTFLPLGVNLQGAGESSTIITANGALPTPGVDQSAADYHLWADGSLIQLVSPIYSGANPRYGDPSLMIAAQNGSQTLSGFTVDGHSKTVKAGVWVQNRNNVTMHHVTFKNMQQSGSVFSRGDMWYYVPLPDGKWMQNTSIHDCTFINAGSTSGGEQVGNLCLGGLDGADVYNISINDPNGEGIKFAHVGHYRNTKIHDCTITVGETDPSWGEKMSMELWNISYNNEVYNITCNTWLSLVNHPQFSDYQPTTAHPSNIKVHDVVMIDGDNVSGGIEAIEHALSGGEIYNCYFQDKGFGIAIWGGSAWAGSIANHDISIHNNIFAKVNTPATFGFGNSAAVFVPDAANNIKIYNNVFDNLGNALQLTSATTVDIKNNIFQDSKGDDIQGGSGLTIKNNLRYNTDPQKPNWVVSGSLGTGNIQGNPNLKKTGSRATSYYQPSSGTSFVVDKGLDVGFPFSGSSPDIGRWEWTSGGRQVTAEEPKEEIFGNELVRVYPNPTTGTVNIAFHPELKVKSVHVVNTQGKSMIIKTAGQLADGVLNLGDFVNDLYLIRVVHQNGVVTKKIMLEK